jgi:hypothetical protein
MFYELTKSMLQIIQGNHIISEFELYNEIQQYFDLIEYVS